LGLDWYSCRIRQAAFLTLRLSGAVQKAWSTGYIPSAGVSNFLIYFMKNAKPEWIFNR
jgi:hypothetical protein